jgi:putative transcriptional regulator
MLPSPENVLQARKAAGMTQTEAGAVLGSHNSVWRKYELGTRQMSAPLWELFLLKTDQHPNLTLMEKPNDNRAFGLSEGR